MISMNRIKYALPILILLGGMPASAQDPHAVQDDLHLSPDLKELLRAEMRELMTGVQSLATGIATADWQEVAEVSAQLRASYILEQQLTAEQKEELKTSLPEHFKRLDADFHAEAEKLEVAASNHDAQLATFHYYRLMESCTACHATYATSRFPGFESAPRDSHAH